MRGEIVRTLAIFRLAVSYIRDYRAIVRAERRLPEEEADRRIREIYEQGGVRFRERAIKLGGLIIKVGQFLSARTDILPIEFTRPLQVLQDQVPAAAFSEVRALIEEAYQKPIGDIFSRFEETPVAAASLGQVHRAVLRDQNKVVAVKVLRPGIRSLAKTDLRALSVVMAFLERYTRIGRRIDTVRVFNEFKRLVGQELDYLHEQDNLVRFWENFAADPLIDVPKAEFEWTRRSVLVMEFMDGVKLTDTHAIENWQLDRVKLSQLLIESFLRQVVVYGHVQIDPHPGNFLASQDGHLIYLDFGMMADIPSEDLRYFADLVEAGVLRRPRGVVTAMDKLGFLRSNANKEILTRAVGVMLDRIWGIPLRKGPALDRVVESFQDFMYEEPLQFPAQYMFLGRAIGMLFALISRLNPDVDWKAVLMDTALPLLSKARRQDKEPGLSEGVRKLVGLIFGPKSEPVVDRVIEGVSEWGKAQWFLPTEWIAFLDKVNGGELRTQPEVTSVLRRLDALNKRVETLILFVIVGGLAVFSEFYRGPLSLTVGIVVDATEAGLIVWGVLLWRRARRLERRPKVRQRFR